MVKVYGYPKSRSLRITWLLEEMAQKYDYQTIDFAKGDHRAAAFLAINPAGKVPAIEDGELVISESAAIVAYLADRYSEGRLIPAAGSAQRARFDQWSYFVISELEQPLWTIGKHKFALPAEHRVAAIMATAQWEFQQALSLLSQGLADNDYLLGPQFSAVDILVAQTLLWGLWFKQPIEQPNLQAYIERLKSRPAMAAAAQRELQALPR